ncbi:MAG: hypothetical protein HEP71_24350 [Roseivirga sp.]|nr:hypothetical protein [Roseivirga sp.]
MKSFFTGYRSRFVYNTILLDAEPSKIWAEITNVQIAQFRFPLLLSILGIPKPLSAEVIREGVGGYREATFSNNARFKQEILEWEPDKKYRFRFNPTTNFKVGHFMNLSKGPFEIETGGYELFVIEGQTKLVLSSNYRLNGLFGTLMHLPFRMIIYYFQKYLLKGIKKNLT